MKTRMLILVESPEPIRNNNDARSFVRHLEKHACNSGEELTLLKFEIVDDNDKNIS